MDFLNPVIIIMNYDTTKITILFLEKCPLGYGILLLKPVTIMATLAYTRLEERWYYNIMYSVLNLDLNNIVKY